MLHVVLFLKKKHIVTPLYGTENIYLEDKCIFFSVFENHGAIECTCIFLSELQAV